WTKAAAWNWKGLETYSCLIKAAPNAKRLSKANSHNTSEWIKDRFTQIDKLESVSTRHLCLSETLPYINSAEEERSTFKRRKMWAAF
ncbi:hypothetical protein ATANTOWER_030262, partial [Ataeniobius toweri]|nr:hypothetical protein [Ataeniobius toweri]